MHDTCTHTHTLMHQANAIGILENTFEHAQHRCSHDAQGVRSITNWNRLVQSSNVKKSHSGVFLHDIYVHHTFTSSLRTCNSTGLGSCAHTHTHVLRSANSKSRSVRFTQLSHTAGTAAIHERDSRYFQQPSTQGVHPYRNVLTHTHTQGCVHT